jgi:hypothetical protein
MNQYINDKSQAFANLSEFFKKDISSLRTGRINPAMLDNVLVEAMATGMTQEEFEAATWDMFADALGSATGADIDGIGELNDVLGRQADREWMEADIWNGVAGRIENLLFAESLSSETVTMSGTAAGDSNQLRLALALQNLGGSMSINSVNGALPLATNLSVASGTEAARLLGQLDPDAPAPAAIAPLSNLSFDSEGWPVSIGSTFTVPGLGSVLAHANNGQPWNIQNQGSDVRYLTYKNGTLASTTSREWWQSVIS